MKPIVNMVLRHVMRRLMSRGTGVGKRSAGKGRTRVGTAFNARNAQRGGRLLRRFLRSR